MAVSRKKEEKDAYNYKNKKKVCIQELGKKQTYNLEEQRKKAPKTMDNAYPSGTRKIFFPCVCVCERERQTDRERVSVYACGVLR